MQVSVVILAAGKGKRMNSSLPKPLFKIMGKEMLFFVLKQAYKISDEVQVVLYHQFDLMRDFVLKHFPKTKIVKQDHKNFPGTGGAIMNIQTNKPKLLVLNADLPLIQLEQFKQDFAGQYDLLLTAFHTDSPNGYGRIIEDKNHNALSIVEQKDLAADQERVNLVNAGVYCFDFESLKQLRGQLNNNNAQKEFYITDLLQCFLTNGKKAKVIKGDEQDFLGVNDVYDLSVVESLMLARRRKYWMRKGVVMRIPESIYLDYDVSFEGSCELENGVQIKGKTLINNSLIKSGSVIDSAVIKNSSIGPMAHIRPKSEINNSKIGNFVEAKNAHLNEVKAGHLSYLGDCEIGEGSNIGAGVITCNYDGKAKHQTKIGKNVFVGSDSQLIAPVSLADHTLVAAGTTLTQNTPEASLVMSRTKQNIIKNGFFKFFKEQSKNN